MPASALHMITASGLLNKDIALWTLLEFLFISKLGELIIDGIDTSVPLFHMLLAEPDIQNGEYNIHWLEKWLAAQFAE